jgi:hypothetical protein
VFRPEPIPSPVVEITGAAVSQHAPSDEAARFATLQGKVRAVVEGAATQRWTLESIESALRARWPDLPAKLAMQVRARLANLTRAGNASPLRRMPDDTWMVNSRENRELALRESKAMQSVRDEASDSQEAGSVEGVVDVSAVMAPLDRNPPPHKPSTTAERIERAERSALRALICAVVMHVDQPTDPVLRALSRGLETLGRQAA